jgi:hypothetical protein
LQIIANHFDEENMFEVGNYLEKNKSNWKTNINLKLNLPLFYNKQK